MEDLKYKYKYPHPAITCDCIVFGFNGSELELLLIERGNDPCKGLWAFPGGFLNIDESAEECALRELQEETGMENISIEQLQTFSDVDRDPRERVITIAYYALVRLSDYRRLHANDDASDAKWFKLSKIPALAFDHQQILKVAITRLRQRLKLGQIEHEPLNEQFTRGELQNIYETILDDEFNEKVKN